MFPTEQLNEPYNQNSNKAASPPLQKVSLIKDQNILLAQSTPSQPLRNDGKRKRHSEINQMPDLLGKSLRDAMLSLSSKSCRLRASGNGYVVQQYPEVGMTLSQDDICILELSNDTQELEKALKREDLAN